MHILAPFQGRSQDGHPAVEDEGRDIGIETAILMPFGAVLRPSWDLLGTLSGPISGANVGFGRSLQGAPRGPRDEPPAVQDNGRPLDSKRVLFGPLSRPSWANPGARLVTFRGVPAASERPRQDRLVLNEGRPLDGKLALLRSSRGRLGALLGPLGAISRLL